MSSLKECWEGYSMEGREWGRDGERERVRWKQKQAGFFGVLGERLTELSAAWHVGGI